MILELGPISRASLLAAAQAADADGRGVALLDGDGWGATELAIDPVDEIRLRSGTLPEITAAFDRLRSPSEGGWAGRRSAARWIGYLAYEAARGLERPAWVGVDLRTRATGEALVLRRYAAVARRDPKSGIVALEADDERSARALVDALHAPRRAIPAARIALSPIDSDDAHVARIERARSLIARGDLYQVNLARTFEGRCDAPATSVLAALVRRGRARFESAIDFGDHAIASASPELFLEVRGDAVTTSPIKGTRPRGDDADRDRALAAELAADPKERAELVMVVDLERNDLGRFAQYGSVRALDEPRIESSRTVHHRVQDVVARRRPGTTLGGILAAVFPSGSVTGAPKIRAMEVIAALEARRRGIYCGAILTIGRDGGLRAAMAIRSVVLDRLGGRAEYHAGGGIVDGSVAEREVAETYWKARAVLG
jgi:anthranilate/para-aminobenzoate synthase component I